jgi:ABC-type transport system substrate-binding protein
VRLKGHWQAWITTAVALAAVACGTTAAPTGQPDGTTSPAVALPGIANPTPHPTPTAAISTPEPAGAAMPAQPVSAKDSITLAMNEEPITMNPYISQGGIAQSPSKDNMVDPLTWQSGDDQRIVSTTATESWQKVDADTWRFELRQGVKFHNGEAWNAQAALPSLAYQGVADNDNSSFNYTAGYKAEAVGEYSVNINCDQACPVFPETAFLLNFSAPDYFKNAPEEEFEKKTVGSDRTSR